MEPVSESKKRVLEESLDEDGPKPKKTKVYSVKLFRKQLQTAEKLLALKEFSSVLTSSNSKHDYIFDYFKHGGNCLELLQILENDSTIPPSLVFDLVTRLLLAISAKHGQFFSSASESCRYLLNNYLPVIHKMLGLSSSKEERKVCLRLLTAIATLSSNLARDILINVKFHSANIELLTKHTGEKDSVRDYFIHFITAFLVDSDSHTLSVLLEKSGLMTSIISGFQYDDVDTVCIVITAMKNHILENPSIMKTTKMHVFNTAVVRDIVNLYNWKGPGGLVSDKNNKTVFEVDKLAKSKVSECVHAFLLVLCSSHRFGVIFRDHLVGLGRKNLNGLMYTILDSLDRPWEHSYASELVIKICQSCPDLTKTMWSIVKPYLEPRLTEKWLNTMRFAHQLIEEMDPRCIEYCAKELNPQQLAQIIQTLVAPVPILKTLCDEGQPIDDIDSIETPKNHIMKLLSFMLGKMRQFLLATQTWTTPENSAKVTQLLGNHVTRHFPNSQILLGDFAKKEVLEQEYLETVLDILTFYKEISPHLLYGLTSGTLDFKNLLLKVAKCDDDVREMMEIKLIGIFLDIDYSIFLPKTNLFSYVLPILLNSYHVRKDINTHNILFKLLQYTGIFDDDYSEISIWLNGIFNLSYLSDDFANYFVDIMRNTSENILNYQKELAEIAVNGANYELESQTILKNILDVENDDDPIAKVKSKGFSTAILGALKHNCSKQSKKYLEFVALNLFHCQTESERFVRVMQKYKNEIPSNIFNYVLSWSQGETVTISKIKGSLSIFKDISDLFLNGALNADLLDVTLYSDFLVDILRMSTFFVAKLTSYGIISENHINNWELIIRKLTYDKMSEVSLKIILENPTIIKHFNVGQLGKNNASDICTNAILKVVEKLPVVGDKYLNCYSHKIFLSICKFLKNPKKHSIPKEINSFLKIFPLSYNNCLTIICKTCQLLPDEDNSSVLLLFTYSLGRINVLCQNDANLRPLDNDIVFNISSFLARFNKSYEDAASLSNVLRQYLQLFPHNIPDIHPDLFVSILNLPEYNKDNVDLALYLLENDFELVERIDANLDFVCERKGVILPIVHLLVNNHAPDKVMQKIYDKLEASILKAMQKPQKVGQHFAKNYDIAWLIERFMPLEKCYSFADKVHKYEVTEVFHAKLLKACFMKILSHLDVDVKHVNNIVTIFMHMEITVLKKKEDSDEVVTKVSELGEIFSDILCKIPSDRIVASEAFRTFSKFALKFGVVTQPILLAILRNLIRLIGKNMEHDDAHLLLDMLLSHSEFFNVVLSDARSTKMEILLLLSVLFHTWPELMEKNHVAIVLSAYRGLMTECDRAALDLMETFESRPEQTRFYDFKPFLWGRAAATHYSVRTQIGNALSRQPKISDVLAILKEDLVNSTISNYTLKEKLHQDTEDLHCYDLTFLLPLFSHILAPEQQVRTYLFTRSGALSLTILGLSSQNKEVRQAACHVLSRLHFHLEARQNGKDTLLWVRFVEALCKGVAIIPNFQLNSFSTIFFARMALILTNPKHVMYTPLSAYLTAKQELDLRTVPELYTLLFSSDVNYKEHRNFILEVLKDGMRSEKDFSDFLKSMGYKLFSELFNSCLSNSHCKLLIYDIIGAICKVPLGVNILIENYSLLPQLASMCSNEKVLGIFLDIVKVRRDKHTNQTIFDICEKALDTDLFPNLKEQHQGRFYEIFYVAHDNCPEIIRDKALFVDKFTSKINDRFCNYIRKYGCTFVNEKCYDLQERNKLHFLRLLVYKLLR